MTTRDLSDLPHPMREALLRLIDAIQQSLPATPAVTSPGESSIPGRFPRQALELLLLETLEANAPMPFSPFQLAALLGQPQIEVRNTLHALAILGTITHVRAGYYSHGAGVPGQTTRKQRDRDREPPPPLPPSARYAVQIARIVATRTAEPPDPPEPPPASFRPPAITHGASGHRRPPTATRTSSTTAQVSPPAACQRRQVTQVARLRLDAGLDDFPAPQSGSKRGPKPKKGARQPSLQQRLADPYTVWHPARVAWYGNQTKAVEWVSGVALWSSPGHDPVRLRWVLVRYAEDSTRAGRKKGQAAAFFCTAITVSALQILAWFVGRWHIEVTFEEARAHLGFETQRQWSLHAIGRTTPCLLGLLSLVVLMAKLLHPDTLPVQPHAWYRKEEATCSDALAAVRAHRWGRMYDTSSLQHIQTSLIPTALWQRVQQVLCYAA